MNNLAKTFFAGYIFMHSGPLSANIEDASFARWKAQQIQHDQRLSRTATSLQQSSHPQNQPKHETAQSSMTRSLGSAVQVNINTATREELVAKLEHIGPKKAQAIIDYRAQHGQFTHVDQLLLIKGIGPKTLEKNRKKVILK